MHLQTIESQIRECYGRVVYTHKTHEKHADLCDKKLAKIKFWQIVFSAIVTAGLLATIFGDTKIGAIFSVVISTTLLALNAYTKNYNLGEISQLHKEAAAKLWSIRESYLSLLTDIKVGDKDLDYIRIKRDNLQRELSSIYKNIPRTSGKAYAMAQNALKELEDMTFSDEEIDKFLPEPLRRTAKTN